MDSFQIETAQNIRISQNVAGIGDRILAFIIDAGILVFYYIFVVVFIISNIGWDSGISQLEILALTLPVMFYTLLFETFSNGRTVGKMALNIRVVKIDGTRPRFSDYLIRWLFRIVDIYM
ncbi:MAG: RDD family protein, partial [Flavobacteriaceae bacterium]|nr:RDD family protein [Flavobacteriaceae bacterium]